METPHITPLDDWFVKEVLPLEAALVRYIRHHWPLADEVNDLRQDIYIRVYEAGATTRPHNAQAFVFATARNLMIDRIRRAKAVPFEALDDADFSEHAMDNMTPERHYAARSELRQLQEAIACLPPACRQVVELRKIAGLSQREVAQQLGIAEGTVEKQISKGIRMLTEAMSNSPKLPALKLVRKPAANTLRTA